jgi:hypothetical protein
MAKGRAKGIVHFSSYDYDRLDGSYHFVKYKSYTHFTWFAHGDNTHPNVYGSN